MAILKANGAPSAPTSDPTRQFYGQVGKADVIVGTDGRDGLWGGDGDVLSGGRGDDTYYVKVASDQVIEAANSGQDKIVTWMSLDLGAYDHVENLKVNGANRFARGNALDNIIEGSDGAQTLDGGAGFDILTGGAGRDVFIFAQGQGDDVITDFDVSADTIRLTSTYSSFAEVHAHLTQRGGDVVLSLTDGDKLVLFGLNVRQLTSTNFTFTGVTLPTATTPITPATPSQTPVTTALTPPVVGAGLLKYNGEAATQTAAAKTDFYGSAGVADRLVGTSGSDSLWGGDGDTLTGGLSDDTYYLKTPSDTVVEAAGGGIDKIVTWMSFDLRKYGQVENLGASGNNISLRGNDLDNILESGAGAQTLDGGQGQDILIGGAGADVFTVTRGEGSDVIRDFSVIEDRLALNGSYKTFAEVQTHLSQLQGDVVLDLGGGEGVLIKNVVLGDLSAANFILPGVSASVTTTVQPTGDGQSANVNSGAPALITTVAPLAPAGQGGASVVAGAPSLQAQLSAQPAGNLYGSSGVADLLQGTSASESLWGGDGDRMIGGGGDDTYYMKSPADVVIEQANEGVDKIISWMSIDLRDYPNVENVGVSGAGLYAAGNNSANYVDGGSGGQEIYGGYGDDVLTGYGGADVFIVVKGQGSDVITDFNVAEDKLRLSAGLTTFGEVAGRLRQQGADTVLDLGGGETLTFRNVQASAFGAGNFQLQIDLTRLGATTFSDDFTGLSLWDKESNPGGTWRTDYGYSGSQAVGSYTLATNGEKQIYTSPYFRDHPGDFRDSPFVVNNDGTISIWAQASTSTEIFGYKYTSGLLTTRETFAQTYGYFEMRADIPENAGGWPAFWMLPKDGSWPPELDIMEVLSRDAQFALTTAHSAQSGHTANGSGHYVPETADGMHTYGALWTPNAIIWYVDHVEVFRAATPADMNKPMYLLANLALGGWGGGVDPAQLPAELQIDYIKAYALPSDWLSF